jgi:hypothetical protein
VHIDSNDVFWMVPVDHDAVEVDFENAQASLSVSALDVFDDHDIANSLTFGLGLPGVLGFPYPAIPPVSPIRARVAFDIEWNGSIATAQIANSVQRFKGLFLQTGATIQWSVEESGFQFQSEPPDPSRNLISVLGREQNGVFFGNSLSTDSRRAS